MSENPTIKQSTLLAQEFAGLEKNTAWQAFKSGLQERYDQALALAMTKANAPEAELRVAVALASAFRTALSLPAGIVQAARTQEELDLMENNDAEH